MPVWHVRDSEEARVAGTGRGTVCLTDHHRLPPRDKRPREDFDQE